MPLGTSQNPYDLMPDFKEKITERRLDMLLKQTTMTGLFSLLFASILTITMQNSVHFVAMCFWLGINIVMVISRELLVYPYIRLKRAQDRMPPNRVFITITAFWIFAGALWGWGAYFYLPGSDQIEIMVTFIAIIVGITSGNIIAFAPAVWVGMLFISLTLSGFLLKLYQYDLLILFYCTLFYLLYLIITMLRVSKVVIHTISLDLKNQQLLQQFTEQKKRAEEEKVKAEKANQSKTEFLSAASHDLRQPLNSMGLFLFALKQKIQSGASDSLQIVEKLEQAHTSLSSMFSRLLEVSSVETGKITAQPTLIATNKTLTAIVDEYRQQGLNKQVPIEYKPNNFSLYTDELLFSRIVRNLVDNAVKYTPKGKITITETLIDNTYRLAIQDTGIGIPKNELDHIFEEYHQVGNKKRDAKQGLGLGLFITFRLCQLLGFKIDVKSIEGDGACFTLSITTGSIDEAKPRDYQAAVLPSLAHLNVLVVDDDIDILNGMKLILEQWHCKVNTASSIKGALALAQNSKPDILLCDYRLEDTLTGLDLLSCLEQDLNQRVATLFITGENISNSAIKHHLKNYLVLQKPVNPTELHHSIKKLTDS